MAAPPAQPETGLAGRHLGQVLPDKSSSTGPTLRKLRERIACCKQRLIGKPNLIRNYGIATLCRYGGNAEHAGIHYAVQYRIARDAVPIVAEIKAKPCGDKLWLRLGST